MFKKKVFPILFALAALVSVQAQITMVAEGDGLKISTTTTSSDGSVVETVYPDLDTASAKARVFSSAIFVFDEIAKRKSELTLLERQGEDLMGIWARLSTVPYRTEVANVYSDAFVGTYKYSTKSGRKMVNQFITITKTPAGGLEIKNADGQSGTIEVLASTNSLCKGFFGQKSKTVDVYLTRVQGGLTGTLDGKPIALVKQ